MLQHNNSDVIRLDSIVSYNAINPETNLVENMIGTVVGFQVLNGKLMVLVKSNDTNEIFVDFDEITSATNKDVTEGTDCLLAEELRKGVIYRMASKEDFTYYVNDNDLIICRETKKILPRSKCGFFYKVK